MTRNIYWMILKNAFRVYRSRINEKIERIFPEFTSMSIYFIYFYFLTQFALIAIILSINFSENQVVREFIGVYGNVLVILKFILEILILNNLTKFLLPKKTHMIYGLLPTMFYILCSNFKYFFTIILLQIIYVKLFNNIIFSVLLFISCVLLFASLYAKINYFNYIERFIKRLLFILIPLFVLNLSNQLFDIFNVQFEITTNQIISVAIITMLSFVILIFAQYLLEKCNNTNHFLEDKHIRQYIKPVVFSVFLLVIIMLLTNTFEIVKRVEEPLVLASFLLTNLFVKNKYINLLTIETYGYFLFYMKSFSRNLQKSVIEKIQFNNYIFILPILLIHLTYLLIQKNLIFSGILLALYILDIKIDELVIHITRKVVKKNELPNLFIHSKKGLSSVLLIAFFPVTLVSFIIKSNQLSLDAVSFNILIILVLLIACVSLVGHTWKRSFFEDLFK